MDYMFLAKEYGWIITVLLLAAAYFYWVFKKRGKAAMLIELRERVFSLMLLAEKKYGDGQGMVKLKWVVDRFYPALPNTAKFIMTREDAFQFVQTIYREARDFMDDGSFNDSNRLRE